MQIDRFLHISELSIDQFILDKWESVLSIDLELKQGDFLNVTIIINITCHQ